MVINDLKQLGAGISNKETMFMQDKRAEWTKNLSFIILSNIKKGVIPTHIFDNIDWRNKNANRSETHHTSFILVQKYNLIENVSKISLDADYNFKRKSHRSCKGCIQELPDCYLTHGSAMDLNEKKSLQSHRLIL